MATNDMSDLVGLQEAKRVLEIAAAGGHSVLLVGALGSGRTALARRLPGILVPLADEALAGLHPDATTTNGMPFRAPHHTISRRAFLGGVKDSSRSEVALAEGGVLFLDEIDEFRAQEVDEAFRLARRLRLSPLLIGAMNTCPCGRPGACTLSCSTARKARFEERCYGLSSMFDCTFNLQPFNPATAGVGETSATIQKRVIAAREFGRKVVRGIPKGDIGARAYKFAETIANLSLSEDILPSHVEEALRITRTGQFKEP